LPSLSLIGKEEGVKGFFKGNGANLIRVMPNTAVKFALFDTYKDILKHHFPTEKKDNTKFFLRTLAAASLSGGSQVAIT